MDVKNMKPTTHGALLSIGILIAGLCVLVALVDGEIGVGVAASFSVGNLMILYGIILFASDKICNAINAQKPKEKP